MATKRSKDGVFWKRAEDRSLMYYWQIGAEKSKPFKNQVECAMSYVEKYVEKNPKYKDMVYDKTWDELFRMFGVRLSGQ